MQTVISGNDSYKKIGKLLADRGLKNILIVSGKHFRDSKVMEYFRSLDINISYFGDFSPNPKYEQVVEGIKTYRDNNCEAIISCGGGSAMDVAKCIKLFADTDLSVYPVGGEYTDTGIFHIAVPTTAGTGSESTRYSVIYKDGVKQSVHDYSIIPDVAILEPALLESLPLYQRKCTLMDAFCQAIESYWSVASCEESKEFAREAIEVIKEKMFKYCSPDSDLETDRAILEAANLAGAAINITATTAAHAMSYKLTSLYGIPHGHAVALSMPHLFKLMDKTELICDEKKREELNNNLSELYGILGVSDNLVASKYFEEILCKLELEAPEISDEQLSLLVSSVNVERLSNHPIPLDGEELRKIYASISK